MKTIIDEFSVLLDGTLVSEFRDTVNEGDFVYNYYSNKDGKNLFNPICSCMDWISVSVRFIGNQPEASDNIDVRVMQVYSLISAIDILTEAVTQLHRILLVDPKLKAWPFNKSNHIFKAKVTHLADKDDDGYFKDIRSIFGAHPTNLKANGEKMFASWPHDHSFDDNDFAVSIYSNTPGKDDITFGIKIKELLEFAKERYEYLIKLDDVIVDTRKSYFHELSQVPIPATGNIHDELETLLVEVERRQNNDYYHMTVKELILLFSSDVKEAHLHDEVEAFRDELYPLVNEIRLNLQSMNLVDLNTEGVLVSRPPKRELSYELGKIFTWLWSDGYDPMADYYHRRLNDYSNGRYNFNLADGVGVTLLKLRVMLAASRKNTILT